MGGGQRLGTDWCQWSRHEEEESWPGLEEGKAAWGQQVWNLSPAVLMSLIQTRPEGTHPSWSTARLFLEGQKGSPHS